MQKQRAINFAHAYAYALHGRRTIHNKQAFSTSYRVGLRLYYRR